MQPKKVLDPRLQLEREYNLGGRLPTDIRDSFETRVFQMTPAAKTLSTSQDFETEVLRRTISDKKVSKISKEKIAAAALRGDLEFIQDNSNYNNNNSNGGIGAAPRMANSASAGSNLSKQSSSGNINKNSNSNLSSSNKNINRSNSSDGSFLEVKSEPAKILVGDPRMLKEYEMDRQIHYFDYKQEFFYQGALGGKNTVSMHRDAYISKTKSSLNKDVVEATNIKNIMTNKFKHDSLEKGRVTLQSLTKEASQLKADDRTDTINRVNYKKKLKEFRQTLLDRLKERQEPQSGAISRLLTDERLLYFLQSYDGYSMSTDAILFLIVTSIDKKTEDDRKRSPISSGMFLSDDYIDEPLYNQGGEGGRQQPVFNSGGGGRNEYEFNEGAGEYSNLDPSAGGTSAQLSAFVRTIHEPKQAIAFSNKLPANFAKDKLGSGFKTVSVLSTGSPHVSQVDKDVKKVAEDAFFKEMDNQIDAIHLVKSEMTKDRTLPSMQFKNFIPDHLLDKLGRKEISFDYIESDYKRKEQMKAQQQLQQQRQSTPQLVLETDLYASSVTSSSKQRKNRQKYVDLDYEDGAEPFDPELETSLASMPSEFISGGRLNNNNNSNSNSIDNNSNNNIINSTNTQPTVGDSTTASVVNASTHAAFDTLTKSNAERVEESKSDYAGQTNIAASRHGSTSQSNSLQITRIPSTHDVKKEVDSGSPSGGEKPTQADKKLSSSSSSSPPPLNMAARLDHPIPRSLKTRENNMTKFDPNMSKDLSMLPAKTIYSSLPGQIAETVKILAHGVPAGMGLALWNKKPKHRGIKKHGNFADRDLDPATSPSNNNNNNNGKKPFISCA